MRASALERSGGFAADAPYCIDLELWLRLLEQGSVFVLEEPVARYRIVSTAWSTQVAESQATMSRGCCARRASGTSSGQ